MWRGGPVRASAHSVGLWQKVINLSHWSKTDINSPVLQTKLHQENFVIRIDSSDKTVYSCIDDVASHFHTLEDPCEPINRLHPLVSVVVISIMAVLAGAAGPTAIAVWAEEKKQFSLANLDLPHKISRVGCVSACVVRFKA